jgi:hypothetical protein
MLDMTDMFDRRMSAILALLLGLMWPLTLGFYVWSDWLWKPVDRDQERIERLRADVEYWRRRVRETPAGQDRDTARDMADALTESLKNAERRS